MGDFSMIKRCTAIAALQSRVTGILPGVGLTSNTEETPYRVDSCVLAQEAGEGYVQSVTSYNDFRRLTFLDKDMVEDVQK